MLSKLISFVLKLWLKLSLCWLKICFRMCCVCVAMFFDSCIVPAALVLAMFAKLDWVPSFSILFGFVVVVVWLTHGNARSPKPALCLIVNRILQSLPKENRQFFSFMGVDITKWNLSWQDSIFAKRTLYFIV